MNAERPSAREYRKHVEMMPPAEREYRKNAEMMPPGAREYRKYAQMKAPSDPPGPLVGKTCLEGKIFCFWRAVLKRRFQDLNLLQIEPFWSLELQGPFLPASQAG